MISEENTAAAFSGACDQEDVIQAVLGLPGADVSPSLDLEESMAVACPAEGYHFPACAASLSRPLV